MGTFGEVGTSVEGTCAVVGTLEAELDNIEVGKSFDAVL